MSLSRPDDLLNKHKKDSKCLDQTIQMLSRASSAPEHILCPEQRGFLVPIWKQNGRLKCLKRHFSVYPSRSSYTNILWVRLTYMLRRYINGPCRRTMLLHCPVHNLWGMAPTTGPGPNRNDRHRLHTFCKHTRQQPDSPPAKPHQVRQVHARVRVRNYAPRYKAAYASNICLPPARIRQTRAQKNVVQEKRR